MDVNLFLVLVALKVRRSLLGELGVEARRVMLLMEGKSKQLVRVLMIRVSRLGKGKGKIQRKSLTLAICGVIRLRLQWRSLVRMRPMLIWRKPMLTWLCKVFGTGALHSLIVSLIIFACSHFMVVYLFSSLICCWFCLTICFFSQLGLLLFVVPFCLLDLSLCLVVSLVVVFLEVPQLLLPSWITLVSFWSFLNTVFQLNAGYLQLLIPWIVVMLLNMVSIFFY